MMRNHQATSLRTIFGFLLSGLLFSACQKKSDIPDPESKTSHPKSAAVKPAEEAPSLASSEDSASDSSLTEVAEPSPVQTDVAWGFTSRPALTAFPGQIYKYHPRMSTSVPFHLALVKGPDSMRLEKGQVVWLPKQEGVFEVIIQATRDDSLSTPLGKPMGQKFSIHVKPVLVLALQPFPAEVKKGEPVNFDLSASTYPAWAEGEIKVRFDYAGDGNWDTEWLPLAENRKHAKVYENPGRFKPKVEARYRELENRSVEGFVNIISSVTAVFSIKPDTVEPGGAVTIDASGSIGDGRLGFSLDLNGDGSPDWRDSVKAKTVLKAPGSGLYQAVLTARNSMGQEGKAMAILRVNAKPKLEFMVKAPKGNMATDFQFRAQAMDSDDSLLQARINYNGDSAGWQSRLEPPDSIINPNNWLLRFHHAYGSVGKHNVTLCLISRDNREVCRTVPIEVFNAPPVCQPGGDIHATLGQPLEIEGGGHDPDGKIVKWEWDLDHDGKYDLVSGENGKFKYTFSKLGVFNLVLRVTTEDGMQATGSRKVEVKKKWKG